MDEIFSLKWNNFQSNVGKTFSMLRHDDDFYDVTLVTDDQNEVSAHKVVLSSCSEYFKNVLKHKKNPHLLLCLEGINIHELNGVLDYIYNGEVKIYQDDLDRFLTVAKRLKLDGLIGEVSEVKDINISQNFGMQDVHEFGENTIDVKDFDSNADEKQKMRHGNHKSTNLVNTEKIETIEELDHMIEQNLQHDINGKWKCMICDKISRDKTDARRHVEIHFDSLSFPCQKCGKIMRSRGTLRIHKQKCKH